MDHKLDVIINLFEEASIRSVWDSTKEDYYFSVVDVIGALTETTRPRKYWSDLKTQLKKEGSELSEKNGQLKLKAQDEKNYNTDVLYTKGILRLVESIPSPKAEPFKVWLASLGNERIDEVFDPEIATRELVKEHKPFGLAENKKIARRGGNIASVAKENLERELGRSVLSSNNALNYRYLDENLLERKSSDINE